MKEDIGHRIDELSAKRERHSRAQKIVGWTAVLAIAVLALTWPPHAGMAILGVFWIWLTHNMVHYDFIKCLTDEIEGCDLQMTHEVADAG